MITFHYRSMQTPTGVINRPYALVSLLHGERRCRRIMLLLPSPKAFGEGPGVRLTLALMSP
jgi:hypothetical protein